MPNSLTINNVFTLNYATWTNMRDKLKLKAFERKMRYLRKIHLRVMGKGTLVNQKMIQPYHLKKPLNAMTNQNLMKLKFWGRETLKTT